METSRRNLLRGGLIILGSLALPSFAFGQEEPIRIGILTDLSGNYADVAGRGTVIGAQMAIEEFGGEIGGRPIELLEADHQNKADIASAIARRWFDDQDVSAIFELTNSAVALAVQGIAHEKQRISVATGAATSALTGEACSPFGMHWVYDTYALANSTAREIINQGGDSWFFITADYAFGHALEADATSLILANGGNVVGSVRHPLSTLDFSSYLLQAQSSGANVIAFANAGRDFSTAISQAADFGVGSASGQTLAALLVTLSEAKAIGTEVAQGLNLTEGFYWDQDEGTREWSQRFFERHGAMPTSFQAGSYSAVRHYLRAIKALGDTQADSAAVVAKMRELPVEDMFAHGGKIREDGRMVHDMIFAQIKSPQETTGEWDLYNIIKIVPGDEAFRPLDAGGCPFVTQ